MIHIQRESFTLAYAKLIKELLYNTPLKGGTKELINCCFEVDCPQTSFNRFYCRNISETYSQAELVWYWSGSNKVSDIGPHAKMWYKLTDDGVTNNSAYGYILERKYGFDQIQQIIELLKKDPTTRRAVLNISDPAIDRINTKDMQCTIAIQFLIRDGKLLTTVYMRSNDVYFGLPYDYIYFVSIAEYISDKLGIPLGKYTHHATSMHMYERDIEKFKTNETKTLELDVKEIIRRVYDDQIQDNYDNHS